MTAMVFWNTYEIQGKFYLRRDGMDTDKYIVVSQPSEFAKYIHAILDGGEMRFSLECEVDGEGDVDSASLYDSYTCWYGMKIVDCFDAACLLVGQVGGENWLAFNITTPMLDKSLVVTAENIFSSLDVIAVCILGEPLHQTKA